MPMEKINRRNTSRTKTIKETVNVPLYKSTIVIQLGYDPQLKDLLASSQDVSIELFKVWLSGSKVLETAHTELSFTKPRTESSWSESWLTGSKSWAGWTW